MEDNQQPNEAPNNSQPPIQKVEASDNSNITDVTQVGRDYHVHHHYPGQHNGGASLVNLPKAYDKFIGRQDALSKIMAALLARNNQPIVMIVGLGGIGKTALAREAVEQSVRNELFNHIVWMSAKSERFSGEAIIQSKVLDYTFDELLSEISRQCNRLDIARMPLDQKKSAVHSLLIERRMLIVLDNLETVSESDMLVDEIFQLLGQSKLILTSRHQNKHEQGFTVNLSGLSDDDSITFLREEGRVHGVSAIAEANLMTLLEIHKATGGAPLAMKLVVGQMSRQPMEFVLKSLKQASTHGQDYEFYRFVYFYSWEMLPEEGKKALVDMSVFPPLSGGALTDVEAISQLESSLFWTAIGQLVLMSLVDKIGVAGKERFALHPLTHYFVLSDITGEWGT